MSKTSILREHVQRYIRATVSDRLREQGFVSKDNDDIHWYRVVNGEVVHAIYFSTAHTWLPVTLDIGYGCHPLFITPQFPSSPYVRYAPGNEVSYPRYILLAPHCNICYSEDILVTCPEDESVVHDILTNIFSVLNSVVSPRDCYDLHKEWRKGQIENNLWIDVSPWFVDEVVFWEDWELYPFCQLYIQREEILLQNALKKNPKSKQFIEELEYLQILKRSIIDGQRDVHMRILEKRKKITIKLLERNTGIRI